MWPYLFVSALSEPIRRMGVARRVRNGREDAERARERFGYASEGRPTGDVIWFHAGGERQSLALMPLLTRLGKELPDVHFLLTTTTYGSLKAIQSTGLPPRVTHQYAPVDAPGPIRRFLDHWRPSAGIHAELDLWPRLIHTAAQRDIPQALINTRITPKEARARRRYGKIFAEMLSHFHRILLQDEASLAEFLKLGADPERSAVAGSLKGAADPLPDIADERAQLSAAIGTRPRWLAAGTDPREEAVLFKAHDIAREGEPGLILFIAPDSPTQAKATTAHARKLFEDVALRSAGDPITRTTAVYVIDAYGEMGLWHRLCPVSFIGQSLNVPGDRLRGRNPFDAASVDALILHGPSVDYYSDDYTALSAAAGTVEVNSPERIAKTVLRAQDPAWRIPYIGGARKVMQDGRQALRDTVQAVMDTYID
ncbi:3-deoxy-D-manno-octulosonic acid transferase [Aliiroseovarius sp. YM-037]|uniref:3-deoxy-D-manno-octulosonic acid transferase n=1 Tax=Aliiroseovarius sp. YM-037 TaxID=3341728 RepID=UPI003A80A442